MSKNYEISFENFQKMLDGSKDWYKMSFGNLFSELFSYLENSEFSLRKCWIFLEKRSKSCSSGYKLECWKFACLCFARIGIKLWTQVWNFSEFAKEFSWKILIFSSKMVKNVSKSTWVQARKLKFCMKIFWKFK
jgi:hypothetical protein